VNVGLAEQVDQLAAALGAGWHVPGTQRTLIDRATVLELIDQIRLGVPEQVRAAQQLLQRRDQVLATAHAEGDVVLAAARRQVRRRLADRSLEQVAARRAAQIEQDAWRAAEVIERQADQDAADSLRWLRTQLDALDQVLARQLLSPEQAHGKPGSSGQSRSMMEADMAGQGQIDVYASRAASRPHDGSEPTARLGRALSEATEISGALAQPALSHRWGHAVRRMVPTVTG
jgi:hypothetical protein